MDAIVAIIVGAAFLMYWVLVEIFKVNVMTAFVLNGIIFVLIGILLLGVPRLRERR